jgi:hypothetical protein
MKPKDNLPITNLKEDELMYPLKPEPILPGGGAGSGEPTIDGWPLWSGLPKPEPVAWTTDLEFDYDTEIIPAKEKGRLGTSMNNIPLYTAPPKKEWVDLTATEIKILRNASNNDREFAALVIARFKEKNT